MKKYIVPIVGFLMIIGIYFWFNQKKSKEDMEKLKIEQKTLEDKKAEMEVLKKEEERRIAEAALQKAEKEAEEKRIEAERAVHIQEIEEQRERERRRIEEECLRKYGNLEHSFQSAKGFWNDKETKIADIKVEARKLLDSGGCGDGTIIDLRNLIEKCDDEL